MDIIKINKVSKIFIDNGKKIKALDNISINIKKGEIFGLLGANGAGKTTLISVLSGLLTRDKGDISIFDLGLDNNFDLIKPRVNIVSGFTMLSTEMDVRQYLTYYGLLYGVKEINKKIDELIGLFELKEKQNKDINQLSSGYKQRVLLAKAMINDPEIIYMDEPTVGLDVHIAKKIRKIILGLKEKGTTIIFTSHNFMEVEQLCERVVLIKKGKIIAQGTIKEIKKKIKNNNLIEVICKKPDDFSEMISKSDLVKEARVFNDTVIIEAKTLEDADNIMKETVNSGHVILSIRRIEPTLEETFIDIINNK